MPLIWVHVVLSCCLCTLAARSCSAPCRRPFRSLVVSLFLSLTKCQCVVYTVQLCTQVLRRVVLFVVFFRENSFFRGCCFLYSRFRRNIYTIIPRCNVRRKYTSRGIFFGEVVFISRVGVPSPSDFVTSPFWRSCIFNEIRET